MVNTVELERIIDDSGKTKTHIAKRCGMTRQSLNNKISGRREFTCSEVLALCNELSITQLSKRDTIFFASEFPKMETRQEEA